MGAPFFVTGLPRSRTAWLSVAASLVPGSYCIHEPIEDLGHWQDVAALWRSGFSERVGVADSSLAYRLGWILDKVGPRTLIVLRDPIEVEASIARLGWGAPGRALCQVLGEEMERHRWHPLVRPVPYHALDRTDVVLDCLQWLMPDAEIDPVSIDRLQRLRVEAKPSRVMDAAMRNPEAMRAALGRDFWQALDLAQRMPA